MKRTKTIAKQLEEQFGGKWTYDKHGTWYSEDGDTRVSRMAASFDEFENAPAQYWMYFADHTKEPRRVYVD